jgi:hypothetical protein
MYFFDGSPPPSISFIAFRFELISASSPSILVILYVYGCCKKLIQVIRIIVLIE